MKKTLPLLMMIAFAGMKAQVNGSLTACYALNGNANDAVSALNGTLGAVTATVDRNSNAGSAISFTGSAAGIITLPNDVKIKPNELSFSVWLKPVNTGNSQYVVFAKNTASSNFEAYALAYTGNSTFIAAKGDNGVVANVFGTATVSPNNWHHVVFTFDNSVIKLYVDGVLDGATNSTITPGYDPAKNIILGGSGESFNLPYNGLMDNVRFYNRVISASEVAQLFSQDPSCQGAPTVDLTTSLTACYPLNGSAADPINALNGTLSAVTSTVDKSNNSASALSFDGTGASAIALPNDARIKSNELTFSAWVKPVTTGSSQYIVFAKNTASSNFEGFALVYNASASFVGIKGDNGSVANAVGTNSIVSNTWHHVAVTLDNNAVKVYLDGTLDGSANSTIVATYDPSKNVFLGGSGEGFNLPYTGCMDNVRFYNRVLNGVEISALYMQDPACAVSATTGISIFARASEAFDLKLYPNPASEILNLEVSGEASGYFSIMDGMGRTIIGGELKANGIGAANIKDLVKGIYLVGINGTSGRKIQKFVKE